MKRIYSVLVENRAGVLCKVAGLFWRRCFNIDSLAVGETEDHAVSNMTIVSSGDQRTLEQIEKQLNKKLDVIKVRTFEESESICSGDSYITYIASCRARVPSEPGSVLL